MLDHTTPLHAAAYQGHTQVVLLLLEMRAESDKTTDLGVAPLQLATSKGNIEIVHLLIKATVDTNRCSRQGGTSMLHSAAEEGNVEMLRLLAMGRAHRCSDNRRWFNTFARCKSPRSYSGGSLAELRAGSDKATRTLPMAILKLLVLGGADKNRATRSDGSTPLTLATEEGHGEIVRYLNQIQVQD